MQEPGEVERRNRENAGVVSEDEAELLRQNLANVLESIKNKPSFFAKVAYFWGERSWWVKVLIGLGITVPFVIIGILTQSITLMIIVASITATYTLFSLLLDNFYKADTELFKQLKEGITSMGDLLGNTINALNTIRLSLAEQVARFRSENRQLQVNNDTLTEENERLKKQVTEITELAEKLQVSNEQIANSSASLLKTTEQNQTLIQQKEAMLQRMREEHAAQLKNFELEIAVLRSNNVDLQKLLNEAEKSIEVLNGLNADVEQVNSEHTLNTNAFLSSMNQTLDEKGTSMAEILSQVSGVGVKLEATSDKLLENFDKNTDLLVQHQAHLTRIGAVLNNPDSFFANTGGQKKEDSQAETLGLQ